MGKKQEKNEVLVDKNFIIKLADVVTRLDKQSQENTEAIKNLSNSIPKSEAALLEDFLKLIPKQSNLSVTWKDNITDNKELQRKTAELTSKIIDICQASGVKSLAGEIFLP